MFIYLVTNKLDSKQYIGQTTRTVAERWTEHCIPSRLDFYIDRAIKKYGADSFEIKVLATAETIPELNELETHYIEEYNTLAPAGYNLHTGGLNHQVSEVTRKKMSESHKGKKLSADHVQAILDGNGGNRYWAGKNHTEEYKKAQSDKMKEVRKNRFWSTKKKTV